VSYGRREPSEDRLEAWWLTSARFAGLSLKSMTLFVQVAAIATSCPAISAITPPCSSGGVTSRRQELAPVLGSGRHWQPAMVEQDASSTPPLT
jgi:hypothetical protein